MGEITMEKGIHVTEYTGRQVCTPRGDPTGESQSVVRIDSGIVKGNQKFQSYLAEHFDALLLDCLGNPSNPAPRPCSTAQIFDDNSFTHGHAYHADGLEIRVHTWGVPKHRSFPSEQLYNMSIEVEGPSHRVAMLKKPLEAYMREVVRTYDLHPLS